MVLLDGVPGLQCRAVTDMNAIKILMINWRYLTRHLFIWNDWTLTACTASSRSFSCSSWGDCCVVGWKSGTMYSNWHYSWLGLHTGLFFHISAELSAHSAALCTAVPFEKLEVDVKCFLSCGVLLHWFLIKWNPTETKLGFLTLYLVFQR